jgi:hypothetical protein
MQVGVSCTTLSEPAWNVTQFAKETYAHLLKSRALSRYKSLKSTRRRGPRSHVRFTKVPSLSVTPRNCRQNAGKQRQRSKTQQRPRGDRLDLPDSLESRAASRLKRSAQFAGARPHREPVRRQEELARHQKWIFRNRSGNSWNP